jgi:glyoxylase I family protein
MRFDHIAIAFKDVERARAWYEEVLGFQVVARKAPSRPNAPQAAYLVVLPGGAAALELMPDDRGQAPGRKPFTTGISHIALAVESFAEWEARLDACKVKWLGPAGDALGGGRVRSFLDPEGNMLQIIERTESPLEDRNP